MSGSDRRWVAVACLSWALVAATFLGGQAPEPAAGYLVRSLQPARRNLGADGRREVRSDLLDRPVLPGSVMKIVTLITALEHNVIDGSTTHVCRRTITVDGVRFVCSHPDLRRPLNAAEALAYSCNDFFVSLAPRLTRDMVNQTRVAAGLPPIGPAVALAPALVGLDGPRITPRALLDLLARVTGFDRDRPIRLQERTRRVLMDGLTGAAAFGSASALGEADISALAKTGTAPMPGGGAMGMVVALTPAERPERAVVVVAPGAAGLDAASIAASILRRDGRESGVGSRESGVASRQSGAGTASPDVRKGTPDSRLPTPGLIPSTIRVGITRDNGRTTMKAMPLEEYVAQVVAGEGEPRAGDAAQQALAIAVRTFALANRNRHRREGFDLCDTTHCQVLRPATPTTERAVAQTAGRVLLHDRQPAFVFYSAWCGGHVERASAVWPGAVDYATGGELDDEACASEPGWTSDLRASDVERALRAAGLRGDRLRDLRIEARSASGRVATLRAVGFSPSIVPAHDFRMAVGRVLGWQRLKSTAFELDRTGAGYRFRGRGFGHGVGLCVIGAGKRAAGGASADDILRFYFPGLQISGTLAGGAKAPPLPKADASATSPPGVNEGSPAVKTAPAAAGIQLALPADEERDRADVLRAIVNARQDVIRRAGMPAPPLIRVTAHPTVESFGRTTGQPWWVSAATLGTAIDLLPTSVLRRQGSLERTLRHEIAHVIVDERLAGRPMWVREGAALYLSATDSTAPSGSAAPSASRVTCPTDQELLRPVSAGTQRDAYARAESCFRRAVAGGKAWHEVK
jgi:SpoIID/LytB domain protein